MFFVYMCLRKKKKNLKKKKKKELKIIIWRNPGGQWEDGRMSAPGCGNRKRIQNEVEYEGSKYYVLESQEFYEGQSQPRFDESCKTMP